MKHFVSDSDHAITQFVMRDPTEIKIRFITQGCRQNFCATHIYYEDVDQEKNFAEMAAKKWVGYIGNDAEDVG